MLVDFSRIKSLLPTGTTDQELIETVRIYKYCSAHLDRRLESTTNRNAVGLLSGKLSADLEKENNS